MKVVRFVSHIPKGPVSETNLERSAIRSGYSTRRRSIKVSADKIRESTGVVKKVKAFTTTKRKRGKTIRGEFLSGGDGKTLNEAKEWWR